MIYHVWTSWFGCIWICLDILVSFCKIISISFVLRICVDLRTIVLNAIGCIYHVFKYIRNVYDSVKFLSDVMSFISALGCSSSLWPVWPVRGDQSDRSRRVLAGVDRSDRSPGTGLTGLWQRHCSCVCLCAIHDILHHRFIYDDHTHLLHPTDAKI